MRDRYCEDYRVITGHSEEYLRELLVRIWFPLGWEPQGGVLRHDSEFSQAIVRRG